MTKEQQIQEIVELEASLDKVFSEMSTSLNRLDMIKNALAKISEHDMSRDWARALYLKQQTHIRTTLEAASSSHALLKKALDSRVRVRAGLKNVAISLEE